MKQFFAWFMAISVLSALFLNGQDSRTVSEPTIPPICVSVDAQLHADHSLAGIATTQIRQRNRLRHACVTRLSISAAKGLWTS
jgi:hypothetical protein